MGALAQNTRNTPMKLQSDYDETFFLVCTVRKLRRALFTVSYTYNWRLAPSSLTLGPQSASSCAGFGLQPYVGAVRLQNRMKKYTVEAGA